MVIIRTKEEKFHSLSRILVLSFYYWQFNRMSEWEFRFHRHFGLLTVSQTQLHFIIFISIIKEKSFYTFMYKNKVLSCVLNCLIIFHLHTQASMLHDVHTATNFLPDIFGLVQNTNKYTKYNWRAKHREVIV